MGQLSAVEVAEVMVVAQDHHRHVLGHRCGRYPAEGADLDRTGPDRMAGQVVDPGGVELDQTQVGRLGGVRDRPVGMQDLGACPYAVGNVAGSLGTQLAHLCLGHRPAQLVEPVHRKIEGGQVPDCWPPQLGDVPDASYADLEDPASFCAFSPDNGQKCAHGASGVTRIRHVDNINDHDHDRGSGGDATRSEIASQPEMWTRALGDDDLGLDRLPADGESVLVLGCGTSYYIGDAWAQLRTGAGRGRTRAAVPTQLTWVDPDEVILLISRSGTTSDVERVGRRLSGDHRVVGLIGTPDSPVEAVCHASVSLAFADETSVVQTRFATTGLAVLRRRAQLDVHVLRPADGIRLYPLYATRRPLP